MSFMPDPRSKGNSMQEFIDTFKEGTPEHQGAVTFAELLKLGHQIIKAMITRVPGDLETSTRNLHAYLESMGVSDAGDRQALGNAIIAVAVNMSPSTYGEDFNDWTD